MLKNTLSKGQSVSAVQCLFCFGLCMHGLQLCRRGCKVLLFVEIKWLTVSWVWWETRFRGSLGSFFLIELSHRNNHNVHNIQWQTWAEPGPEAAQVDAEAALCLQHCPAFSRDFLCFVKCLQQLIACCKVKSECLKISIHSLFDSWNGLGECSCAGVGQEQSYNILQHACLPKMRIINQHVATAIDAVWDGVWLERWRGN